MAVKVHRQRSRMVQILISRRSAQESAGPATAANGEIDAGFEHDFEKTKPICRMLT